MLPSRLPTCTWYLQQTHIRTAMPPKKQWVCHCSQHGGQVHYVRTRTQLREHHQADQLRQFDGMRLRSTRTINTPGHGPAQDLAGIADLAPPSNQPPKRRRNSGSTMSRIVLQTPQTFFRKDEGSIHSSQFEVGSVSHDETGLSISPPHVHKRNKKNKPRDLKQNDYEQSDPHDDHANLPRKSETSM